jgi:hypothetical protein
VVIAELEWSQMGDSELQRTDVGRLLEPSGDRPDRACLEKWVDALGLEKEWSSILERLESEPSDP